MRRGKKATRGGRFLAIVLAMAMIFQQAGIDTLAEELNSSNETIVTDADTDASSDNSNSEETTAAEVSAETTAAESSGESSGDG